MLKTLAISKHLAVCLFLMLPFIAKPRYAIAGSSVPPSGKDLLPIWETAEEAALRAIYGWPADAREFDDPPPYQPIAKAEFVPFDGTLLRWHGDSYNSTFVELVDAVQEEGMVWIAVETSYHESQVRSLLQNGGVPFTNLEFLYVDTNSIWIRDYGPFFIFDPDGDVAIVDIIYDRYGRWDDDAYPQWLAGQWGMSRFAPPLRLEGGNFVADGCGTCFATERIYEQNEGYLTPEEVDQIMADYLGCEQFITLQRMIGDGTGHIDMFFKLIDPDTVLINQVSPGDTNYQILEDNAATMASLEAPTGYPYEVVRIPMGNNYRTYSNSYFINSIVTIPYYYGGSGLDAEAHSIYQTVMPGKSIIGVDSSGMVGTGGSIHCITMGVPSSCPLPDAPANLSIEATSSGALRLEWDLVPDANLYRIYRSLIDCDHSLEAINDVLAPPYIDASVSPGSTYYYRISTLNQCGESETSACVWETAGSPASPTPEPPTSTPSPPPHTPTPAPPTSTPSPPPHTPTSTPTRTPVTPTFTPQIPTETPPLSPSPTTTATPTPHQQQPWITLDLNAHYYRVGDLFKLVCNWGNPGSDLQVDEYLILDVWQEYWFWPSWSRIVDFKRLNIHHGETSTETILQFSWPADSGSAEGIRFWTAFLQAGGTTLVSEIDSVEFSFGD